jgi:hypothetical protein
MVAAASDLRAGVCEDDATMSERDDLLDVIATREATIYAQAEQIAALQKALKRAAYVAEHLFAMIDRETWRDNGADDGQGHYEGDYHAEQVRDEIAGWKALALAEGCAAPARTSGPLCMDSRCAHPKGFHRKGHGSCLECACIAFKPAPADEEEK